MKSIIKPYGIILACLAALPCAGQVALVKDADRVHVEIDGKPFGDLYFGPEAPKPYFSPLRSASGKIVTRQWPMAADLGESKDHQHHRGLWLGYIDVNGSNFWENEFSYHRANAGKMVTRSIEVVSTGGKSGALHAVIDWLDSAGHKTLTEDRTMTFSAGNGLRIVDFDATLTAAVDAVFGDDKDGAFGIRMADGLTEKTGAGVITNSTGARTMKEAWGKPASWLDYSGTVDGEPAGIAIFESPKSFHHPTRWHARDYGLVAANPFADHAYEPAEAARNFKLKAGENLHLRYRVVVHGKLDQAAIQKLYDAWAKSQS